MRRFFVEHFRMKIEKPYGRKVAYGQPNTHLKILKSPKLKIKKVTLHSSFRSSTSRHASISPPTQCYSPYSPGWEKVEQTRRKQKYPWCE